MVSRGPFCDRCGTNDLPHSTLSGIWGKLCLYRRWLANVEKFKIEKRRKGKGEIQFGILYGPLVNEPGILQKAILPWRVTGALCPPDQGR